MVQERLNKVRQVRVGLLSAASTVDDFAILAV